MKPMIYQPDQERYEALIRIIDKLLENYDNRQLCPDCDLYDRQHSSDCLFVEVLKERDENANTVSR